MHIYHAMYRLWRIIVLSAVALSASFIAGITVLTLVGAFARYGLNQPLAWNIPIVSYLLLYAIYMGTAYTLYKGDHISVTFALDLLPGRVRPYVEIAGHILGLTAVCVLLWQSAGVVSEAIRMQARDTSILHIPEAATTVVMPVGLSILAVTYCFLIINAIIAHYNNLISSHGSHDA
jgi:TRAP-type C4-dicarboxylate transport system permease small subunit